MKKLHVFVLKSYIGPFFATLFIAMFFLLMQFLWKYIDDLVGKGLEFSVITELLVYASASLVPMALPLAILLSAIMTFGNLGEHNELLALKSAGISLLSIMRPLMVLVFFLSIGAFYFANNILPVTNLKMSSLLWSVRQQRPEMSIKPGVFSDALEGYVIKVSSKDKKTGMLYNVMIYDHIENNGNRVVTIADSATMEVTTDNKYMVMVLYSGMSYEEVAEKKRRNEDKEYPHRTDKFDKQRILVDMSGFGFERTDETLFKNNVQMLNIRQLNFTIDSLNTSYSRRLDYFIDNLHKTTYLKRIEPRIKDSLWLTADTIIHSKINIDTAFSQLSQMQKISVIENAKNYARSAKSMISATNTEMVHKQKWIKRHEIEWHKKLSLALSCLILFFIGAPLGAIIRKGGLGTPVVISVFFFVIYYVISISGEKSAKILVWPPWLGIWLSAIVLLPIGIFLTYKAANDSVILNTDTYIKAMQRFFMFRQKIKEKHKNKLNNISKQKNIN